MFVVCVRSIKKALKNIFETYQKYRKILHLKWCWFCFKTQKKEKHLFHCNCIEIVIEKKMCMNGVWVWSNRVREKEWEKQESQMKNRFPLFNVFFFAVVIFSKWKAHCMNISKALVVVWLFILVWCGMRVVYGCTLERIMPKTKMLYVV